MTQARAPLKGRWRHYLFRLARFCLAGDVTLWNVASTVGFVVDDARYDGYGQFPRCGRANLTLAVASLDTTRMSPVVARRRRAAMDAPLQDKRFRLCVSGTTCPSCEHHPERACGCGGSRCEG